MIPNDYPIISNLTNEKFSLLVGGYTGEQARGIEIYDFDTQWGQLSYNGQSTELENPSYICLDSTGKMVYAVSEQEEEGGNVYAFTFDRQNGKLTFLNKQPANGTAACYVAIDKQRKHAFVANYKSGSLSVFPLAENGSLLPLCQHIQQQGSSINPRRQEGPHVHMAQLSPDERYLIFTDLGTDKLHSYSYQSHQQTPLSLVSTTLIQPGSGPRHLTFSPGGQFVYLVTEMSGDVIVFHFDLGELKQIQTITLLADNFEGEAGGGDIRISSDGLFLYVSNRGDANEIVIFSIDKQSGLITLIQHSSCMGKSPRNIMIDPTGGYLHVANQESNNIIVFKRDEITGLISGIASIANAQQPSCLQFVQG